MFAGLIANMCKRIRRAAEMAGLVLPAGPDLIPPCLCQDRPRVRELVRDQAQLTEYPDGISAECEVQLIRRGRPRPDPDQFTGSRGQGVVHAASIVGTRK